MKTFGALLYGDDGTGKDTVFITNVLGDNECERHLCCGSELEVNDVLWLEPVTKTRLVARKVELACISCDVGNLLSKNTSEAIVKKFSNAMVQVIRTHFPGDSFEDEGEAFKKAVLQNNGLAEAIIIGTRIY